MTGWRAVSSVAASPIPRIWYLDLPTLLGTIHPMKEVVIDGNEQTQIRLLLHDDRAEIRVYTRVAARWFLVPEGGATLTRSGVLHLLGCLGQWVGQDYGKLRKVVEAVLAEGIPLLAKCLGKDFREGTRLAGVLDRLEEAITLRDP